MPEEHAVLDDIDKRILNLLQKDCRITMSQIADELKIPKSTVHYRVKGLEAKKIIEGYRAKVDATKLRKDFITITSVRAKYGPRYHEKVGKLLAEIPGVVAVYFVFGDSDFIFVTRSADREEFLTKLEKMTKIAEIERTNTQIVAKTLKEDDRINL